AACPPLLGKIIVPLTTETALLSCIKQAREDVLTLRHLQLLHQNR
ncbi:hypothetical protein ACUWFH_05540, partial [Escherichia coli]